MLHIYPSFPFNNTREKIFSILFTNQNSNLKNILTFINSKFCVTFTHKARIFHRTFLIIFSIFLKSLEKLKD